ncbi:hypothetical protein LT85_3815 [Collimonas arenae]|uniref:TIR domain-containing protein n=1 Tax=Collimonas arenae TaxID=279058 RepID=A0A0A1FDZ1_9BURK|nr:toll/interleukin-1 receptor domain-containing protein [Collimonas arenae]AIY42973.1 hypothetical protein LT85_3815 [Collimonas arenae]
MQKPTIFFSHSSRDKNYISALRRKVLKATSKTIEIFQSSDGESIPFGNNWVHKIEENLDKAKIMLVFVSPQSVNSNWIHFESGFAYAKGVKVIPIGIKSIDVGKLSPPINLLQGFNIVSEAGMNNIVTIINREFNCDFAEDFTSEDHDELSLHDETIASLVPSFIDYFQFTFASKIAVTESEPVCIVEEPLKAVEKCFEQLGIEFNYATKEKIQCAGITLLLHPERNGTQPPSPGSIELKMDPYHFSNCAGIIKGLCTALYRDKTLAKFWCDVFFQEPIQLETTDFKVSSRLHQVGLSMSKSYPNHYKFESVDFSLLDQSSFFRKHSAAPPEKFLHVIFDSDNLPSNQILKLISVLQEARVICK